MVTATTNVVISDFYGFSTWALCLGNCCLAGTTGVTPLAVINNAPVRLAREAVRDLNCPVSEKVLGRFHRWHELRSVIALEASEHAMKYFSRLALAGLAGCLLSLDVGVASAAPSCS